MKHLKHIEMLGRKVPGGHTSSPGYIQQLRLAVLILLQIHLRIFPSISVVLIRGQICPLRGHFATSGTRLFFIVMTCVWGRGAGPHPTCLGWPPPQRMTQASILPKLGNPAIHSLEYFADFRHFSSKHFITLSARVHALFMAPF